jgi:hypothetical protein
MDGNIALLLRLLRVFLVIYMATWPSRHAEREPLVASKPRAQQLRASLPQPTGPRTFPRRPQNPPKSVSVDI